MVLASMQVGELPVGRAAPLLATSDDRIRRRWPGVSVSREVWLAAEASARDEMQQGRGGSSRSGTASAQDQTPGVDAQSGDSAADQFTRRD